MNEKFRKSELNLLQNMDQYDVDRMLGDETSNANIILYSSIIGIGLNLPVVEHQYSK